MYRRILLLGLIRQGETHGYRLNDFIDRMLQVCSDLKRSTAYFLLGKLEQEGYVTVSSDREGNYPERRVYSITPSGDAYFFELLRENLADFDQVRYPGDVGIAFIHELPVAERRDLLNARRAKLAALVEMMEEVPSHGGSLDFVISRNLALLHAELAWLDGVMDKIGETNSLYSFSEPQTDRKHQGLRGAKHPV